MCFEVLMDYEHPFVAALCGSVCQQSCLAGIREGPLSVKEYLYFLSASIVKLELFNTVSSFTLCFGVQC